jgi:hypothetical protein
MTKIWRMFSALGLGSSITLAWTAALVLTSLVACNSVGTVDQEMGTLQLRLETSVRGVTYRLHHAKIQLSGPEEASLEADDDLTGKDTLSRTLMTGMYEVRLKDGWVLEQRYGSNGQFKAVKAKLISDNPLRAEVTEQETAKVAFAFSVDGAEVNLGQGAIEIEIEVVDSPPVLTPIEDNQAAARALDSAMILVANIYQPTHAFVSRAELVTQAILRCARDANFSPVGLVDGGVSTRDIACPEGGSYLMTWRAAAHDRLDTAVTLHIQYDACRGLQGPELADWVAQDDGDVELGLTPGPDAQLLVQSATFGNESAGYVRRYYHRYEMVLTSIETSKFRASGRFTQNSDLLGEFDYRITGYVEDQRYVQMGGDPTNAWYSGLDRFDADRLHISGHRNQAGSDIDLLLAFDGSMATATDDWNLTRRLGFKFNNFSLAVTDRYATEGNKSLALDGIVGMSFTGPSVDDGCVGGTYHYQTPTPLLDELDYWGSLPQLSQGVLIINGNTAAVSRRHNLLELSVGAAPPVEFGAGANSMIQDLMSTAGCFIGY